MKLPWDRNYFKICFYAVFAFLLGYILKIGIDAVVYTIANMDDVYAGATQGFFKIISVFSALIWGFVIFYILDPVVGFFQTLVDRVFNRKNNRLRREGTIITYLIIMAIIALIVTLMVLRLTKVGGGSLAESVRLQINAFSEDINALYIRLEGYLIELGVYSYIKVYINEITKWISSFILNFSNRAVNAVTVVGSSVVNILLSIVIAFYFLKDKYFIKNKIFKISNSILSKKQLQRFFVVTQDIDSVFSGYIRGQLTDALIMAVLIGLGLSIIRVRFSVVIGIISGFSNIIPYFGALMGFVLAVGTALLSGEPMKALYAGIMLLVLQQIDSAVIVPKVVGESVELSPVMVIVALAVAGKLFGIWGMVFAVPVVAVIKIFATRIYNRIVIRKANN